MQPFNLLSEEIEKLLDNKVTWVSGLISVLLAFSAMAKNPRSLETVLEHSNPLSLYVSAYQGFQLTINTELQVKKDEAVFTRQGLSLLKVVPQDHSFILKRQLLAHDKVIELTCKHDSCLVKQDQDSSSHKLPMQKEFERWQQQLLPDIFSLYQQVGFSEWKEMTAPQKTQEQCWRADAGLICIDPTHSLPLRGDISINISSASVMLLRFNIEPFLK